jgi:hypothetical protein
MLSQREFIGILASIGSSTHTDLDLDSTGGDSPSRRREAG